MSENRCGYVAIIGRPNVGKSTLLNHLLKQKLSITSRKPQTTRHRLLGIKNTDNSQIIYVDTPGLHQKTQDNALNRYLNRIAIGSLGEVSVVLWLVEALRWQEEDEQVLEVLEQITLPVILGVNKIDKVKPKSQLLPYLQTIAEKRKFTEIFPISASKNKQLTELETKITQLLPVGIPLFPEEYITDRSERFLVAELIREKLVRCLGAELPYRITVQLDHFSQRKTITHLSAIIWVERSSQKAIVIGKAGKMLKKVGETARQDIEILLAQKVFLQLWVKVRQGWCNDEQALQQFGYVE